MIACVHCTMICTVRVYILGYLVNKLHFSLAIDYLKSILEEKDEQEQEIDSLKKEVLALQIMKA